MLHTKNIPVNHFYIFNNKQKKAKRAKKSLIFSCFCYFLEALRVVRSKPQQHNISQFL